MDINNIEKASELKREIDALRKIGTSCSITVAGDARSWEYNTSEQGTPYMRDAIAKLLYERIETLKKQIEEL